MSKIICDICGTSYADSAECCPICGCSSTAAAELLNADSDFEEVTETTDAEVTQTPENPRKKEIFDFDEVNAPDVEEEPDEDYDEEEEEEEEAPRHNTFVVILLTVLIVVLLGAAAFIFVRYFLPNMGKEDPVPVTTAAIEETETSAPTTEPTVPCQQMVMTSAGVAELSAEGQQFLLHIKALPENTTDKIIYTSGDESIATVTEDGKITAVSEGETVIYISCGAYFIDCPVIVKYVEETVPATTEAVEETVPEVTETEPQETVAETAATEAPEQENDSSNDSPADAQEQKNVVLKLKKTDIQLGVYYQFQLVLDCDLEPEEVTWSSEHPHIAKVDEKGNVTAVKEGTTAITAKYGDQEVQCIVRCIWY